ncbi:MAG: SDR family NAD(P)-dependent oxidoreductase, partial [Pseudomonadota bacterium]
MAVTDQTPTQSGFHAKSAGAEVMEGIDLTGKTAVVTGGYSGIGLETVRCLVDAGANVVVPVRSPEKAAEALRQFGDRVETAAMDLADLQSVQNFADNLCASRSQ